MEQLFDTDVWKIIETGFHPSYNNVTESVMSLGNGHFGIRGNFEETFSGPSLKGTYIAGVYYPDKTKVGWWKNGYPEYFAKVPNSCDFLSVKLIADGEEIDLSNSRLLEFKRVLDMKNGSLERECTVALASGKRISISSIRFLSMDDKEIGALKYNIASLDSDVNVELVSYLNGDMRNSDSNYGEMFWEKESLTVQDDFCSLSMSTKKTDFLVSTSIASDFLIDSQRTAEVHIDTDGELYAGHMVKASIKAGSSLTLYKYFSATTSRDYARKDVMATSALKVQKARDEGFETLYSKHIVKWTQIWEKSDICIEGDDCAQQGVRFNIFHLNQTYTGDDSRLNIGPKGMTGEKYGGGAYWDTEMFCLPFYLSTANERVTKNLLLFRYNHLEKAKENAKKLGLQGALYPMVTMNGEECHNEWEITFEEIHRNAAIAYAIYNYVNYTGDKDYLLKYGIYVLVETARFWASRVDFNQRTKKYMLLGVTGPNEYENNVNNNWYTNMMAAFSLRYTVQTAAESAKTNPAVYAEAKKKLKLTQTELDEFSDIAENIYYPYIEEFGVFSQQDGYADKTFAQASGINASERPINQHWSWDRILRSCYIKQADVIQGICNFPFEFESETKTRNFDFYEPMTVHESSLSAAVYSIVAAEIGYLQKAYELFLRASRLDLGDYNNDTADGLHITSMGGAWASIVHGFGGLRFKEGYLGLSPVLPRQWKQYSFKLYYRGTTLNVTVTKSKLAVTHESGGAAELYIYGNKYILEPQCMFFVNINKQQ